MADITPQPRIWIGGTELNYSGRKLVRYLIRREAEQLRTRAETAAYVLALLDAVETPPAIDETDSSDGSACAVVHASGPGRRDV